MAKLEQTLVALTEKVAAEFNRIRSERGALVSLETVDKTSIVAAINELSDKIIISSGGAQAAAASEAKQAAAAATAAVDAVKVEAARLEALARNLEQASQRNSNDYEF